MNFSFVASLQSMAATEIVTRLWNRADVVDLIAECNEADRGCCWRKVEEKVNEKKSLLPLPAPLREKMSSVVVPIGDQIRRWKWIHVVLYRFQNIPREFCWTSRGTLDKKGTAEVFVRDPTLPEVERYRMACLYCLEWDDSVPFDPASEFRPMSEFEAYWTYVKTGDATALHSTLERDPSKTPYQQAFGCAVEFDNEVAAEYYFRKLNPAEREESLSDVELPDFYFAGFLPGFDICRFLLQLMNEEQQTEKLEKFPEIVLECLLEYPWQQFFIDVAPLLRYQYTDLLLKIVCKISDGYKDYDYRELFGALWVQIPVEHRKRVMRDPYLLDKLLGGVGQKNVTLMLKDASAKVKERIIFSKKGFDICSRLADVDDRDGFRSFVGECLSSRDKMIRFKEECKRRNVNFNQRCILKFIPILDELIENSGGEEADCTIPKNLCSS